MLTRGHAGWVSQNGLKLDGREPVNQILTQALTFSLSRVGYFALALSQEDDSESLLRYCEA